MKKRTITILTLALATLCTAQPTADCRKLSAHLSALVRSRDAAKARHRQSQQPSDILSLMKLSDAADAQTVARRYGCTIVDSVGRIYIVRIPLDSVVTMTADARVLRLEAERMPRPAMDVTPARVNATDVYTGTNLPQAYTGRGVAAGVFDIAFDFTHPAFLDENGHTRARYYYDFHWPNADGTLGHALDSADDIEAYGHSQHTSHHIHGTHVMGIMAGRAVDGKYQGMAPEADLYIADFNSTRDEFANPDEQTSATAVLGFKYLFDRAQHDGKPCVVNLSSCESITISRQRELETEALSQLTGSGRIIVAAAGNDGFRTAYMEKPADTRQAGVGIINGVGNGGIIDMDIVTPGPQQVRFDFLGLKLTGGSIEGTIRFTTDSIDALNGDTCTLTTTTSMGDVLLSVYPSHYQDPRGRVYHVDGQLPSVAYLLLCGAACLLTGDGPAWMYSDLFYSPFTNISGVPEYCHAAEGYSVSWPATMDGVISVGATGYKNTFRNLDGQTNTDMLSFAPDRDGHITQFSSRGPTFDGRTKPDVVAPGMNINAPYNSFAGDFEEYRKVITDHVKYDGRDYYYMAESGTSMAAPVVAGAVALWLQAKPDLTPAEVLDVISHTATHPDASLTYPNNTYGYGQLDVYHGLLYVLGLPSAIPSISLHQPAQARFTLNGRQLTVQYAAATTSPDSPTLTVYTTDGRTVATVHGTSIDLSALSPGVYAVQLHTARAETTGSTLIRIK